MTKKSAFVLGTKLTIAVAILVFLVVSGRLTIEPLLALLSSPATAFAFFLLHVVVILLAVTRWRLLLGAMAGRVLPFGQLLRFSWIGLFLSTVGPAILTTDGTKYLYVKHRLQVPSAAILGSLVLDRVFALGALTALFLAFGLTIPATVLSTDEAVVLAVVGVSAGLVAWTAYAFRYRLRLDRIVDPTVEGLKQVFRRPAVPFGALAISLVSHAVKIGMFYLLILLVQPPDLSLVELIAICSVGFFVEAVPITPAGIGTCHLAFSYLFALHGVEDGAGIYNVYLLGRLAINSVGAFLWLRR